MEYDSRLTLCTTLLTRTSITRASAQRVLYCVEMGDRDNDITIRMVLKNMIKFIHSLRISLLLIK